jgi:hypothetical protein
VRISGNGQRLWDRSYGGYSQSINISGNKGVDGEGTWLLKLDTRGLKEAEFLLPGDYQNIFAKGCGFSVVGWGTNCCSTLTSVDLNALRRASVTARPVDARPYNVDVSTNLTTWTPLVLGSTDELNLLETFVGDRKFYRVTEP